MKKLVFPICCLFLFACGKEESTDVAKNTDKAPGSGAPVYVPPVLPDCTGLSEAMRQCTPFQCHEDLPLSFAKVTKRKVVHGVRNGRCHYSEYTKDHQTMACAFMQTTGRALADFQDKIFAAGDAASVTGSAQTGVNDFFISGQKLENPFISAVVQKTCIIPATSFKDGKPYCSGVPSLTFTVKKEDGTYEDQVVECNS